MNIDEYLKHLVLVGGSDLYISAGATPMARIEGAIHPIAEQAISMEDAAALFDAFLTDEQKRQFDTDLELNIALQIDQVGRFRLNLFRQQGGVGMVARHVRDKIPSTEALGLPTRLQDYIAEERHAERPCRHRLAGDIG